MQHLCKSFSPPPVSIVNMEPSVTLTSCKLAKITGDPVEVI
jgi:hypothetical protein